MSEDTRIVISAVDKTSKGFKSVGAGLGRITKSLFSMRTALVGVAGAAGFGYLIKSSLNATDNLSKVASKIGTTTEALSRLQYAAQISGVETNTLNMALQRFTRRAAEAAQGTGEAKNAIRELGLDARKLQQLPLDQQMLQLANAFEQVDTEADKLRIAFKLFDSEGAALVNTLALGSDGMEKLFGRAKSLGIVMSSEAALGAEKANDAFTDLLFIGKGLKDQFSAALAPAIADAAKALTDFLIKTSKAEGGIAKFAQTLAVGFLEGIRSVIIALDQLSVNLDTVSNAAGNFFMKFEQNAKKGRFEYLQSKLSDLQDLQEVMLSGGTKGIGIIDYMMYGKGKAGASKVQKDINAIVGELTVLQAELAEGKDKALSFGTNLGGLIDADKVNETFDRLIKTIGKLGEANESALKPTVDVLGSFEQGVKSFSNSIPTMEENIKSLTTQGLNGLTDALTAGITGAANFADAMKAMAKSVVDSLIKMLIQKYIVDAAFNVITASFGGSSSPVAGGKPSVPVMSGAGSRPMSPRAIGGSVQAGQPYMVGERGQEMFVPNQSGSIIPSNKLGGGGGVTVNQVINVTTGVQQTVRAEIATLMPQIANAAKTAVVDARQRGGGYSKALLGA
jgi:hypothetical protein